MGSTTGKRTSKGETGKSRFAHPTLGFGVPANPHHLQVIIPKENHGAVLITEQLGMQAQDQHAAMIDRCLMDLSHFISNKALDRDVRDAAEILTGRLRNLRLA
ncbi:DUF3780 domain-containing protein [Endozoicomonas sp. ALB115]|uniref:DUF3780 domain-containing protein n=1 Tax=Endozoicomonas sp. ALB115 TaxID=3403074 RepID=UPI003BB79D11